MVRKFQTSSDIGGEGKTISKPGTYHCSVIRSADGESTKGNQMDGCSALLSVLAGTESDQEGKEFHLHLYDPDYSKSEASQNWSIKKQTAYAIAINQMTPEQMGTELDLDFGAAESHQIIITIEASEYEGKTKLDLSYANIYHVDDPRAKNFPKSKEALSVLPEGLRKDEAFFGPLVKKTSPPAMKSGRKEMTNSELTAGL